MDKMKILIVDDDEHIAELLSLYLNKEGYETKEIYSGKNIISEINSFNPNMILLDVMLPEIDGYEICKEIRKFSKVPVIMLTAKGETFDKVLGLELGADDYIVKPFETKEVVARIKAVFRRYEEKNAFSDDKIVVENMIIDLSNYTVKYHDKLLELPPKEFELLSFLVKNPNQVFTREKLLDKIWGYEFVGDTRTVDVHIKRIREKINLSDDNWGIKTVWGVGYKFENN